MNCQVCKAAYPAKPMMGKGGGKGKKGANGPNKSKGKKGGGNPSPSQLDKAKEEWRKETDLMMTTMRKEIADAMTKGDESKISELLTEKKEAVKVLSFPEVNKAMKDTQARVDAIVRKVDAKTQELHALEEDFMSAKTIADKAKDEFDTMVERLAEKNAGARIGGAPQQGQASTAALFPGVNFDEAAEKLDKESALEFRKALDAILAGQAKVMKFLGTISSDAPMTDAAGAEGQEVKEQVARVPEERAGTEGEAEKKEEEKKERLKSTEAALTAKLAQKREQEAKEKQAKQEKAKEEVAEAAKQRSRASGSGANPAAKPAAKPADA